MDYRKVGVVGSLLIVALITTLALLSPSEIMQLLDENPTAQLILVEGFQANRFELISRSIDPEVKYFKWYFEDGKVKAFQESTLLSSAEWKLFSSSTLMSNRTVRPLQWNYSRTDAWVTETSDYWNGSVFVGTAYRKILIKSDGLKESIEFVSNRTDLRLQYSVTASEYNDGVKVTLTDNTSFEKENFILDWAVDKSRVTSAIKYGNGNIQINFARGEYRIDPTIKIGKYHITYGLAPAGYGRKYEADLTFGNLPLSLEISKDMTVSNEFFSTFLEPPNNPFSHNITSISFEHAENVSYVESNWISNLSCVTGYSENMTAYQNCTDNGHVQNTTKWRIEWRPFGANYTLRKNQLNVINIHAEWMAQTGSFSEDVIPSINGYPLSDLAWWNTSWYNRVPITVNSSVNLTSYPLAMNVTFDADMQADFDDLRFTSATNGSLRFWLQEKSNSVYAYVWVNGSWNTNNGTQAYMYYNNSDASSGSTNVNWTNDLNTGLISYFNTDEPSGTTIYDGLGVNNGTIYGATVNQPGLLNKTYYYDGNDYTAITKNTGLNLTGNFTISHWIKFYALPTADVGYFDTADVGAAGWMFYYATTGDDKLNFFAYSLSDTNVLSTTTPANGTWYHVVVTYNGTRLALWVNGTIEDDDASTGAITGNARIPWIGRYWHTPSLNITGEVDEIGFWNVSLTPTQISHLFSSGVGINYDGSAIYPIPTYSFGSEEGQGSVDLVTLISPTNNTNTGSTTPNFVFNFSSGFSIASCELCLNSTGYGANASAYNATNTTITANATLAVGLWKWNVTCTNGTASKTSETRDLFVGFVKLEITSPADNFRTEDNTPDFVFNNTLGVVATSTCQLFINSTGYGMNASVFNVTSTTLTANASLTYGYWTWLITCTNGTLTNSSASRGLYVRKLMSGNVKDDVGNNVENATVLIISQFAKTIYGTNSTGNDGNWTYEVWVAGNYTVVAYSWNDTTQDGDADPWIEVT